MGTHGDLLVLMGTTWDLWGPVETYGGPWGPMGTCGDLWGPAGTFGALQAPMGAYGGLWGPLVTYGGLLAPTATHGGLWGPMVMMQTFSVSIFFRSLFVIARPASHAAWWSLGALLKGGAEQKKSSGFLGTTLPSWGLALDKVGVTAVQDYYQQRGGSYLHGEDTRAR